MFEFHTTRSCWIEDPEENKWMSSCPLRSPYMHCTGAFDIHPKFIKECTTTTRWRTAHKHSSCNVFHTCEHDSCEKEKYEHASCHVWWWNDVFAARTYKYMAITQCKVAKTSIHILSFCKLKLFIFHLLRTFHFCIFVPRLRIASLKAHSTPFFTDNIVKSNHVYLCACSVNTAQCAACSAWLVRE